MEEQSAKSQMKLIYFADAVCGIYRAKAVSYPPAVAKKAHAKERRDENEPPAVITSTFSQVASAEARKAPAAEEPLRPRA